MYAYLSFTPETYLLAVCAIFVQSTFHLLDGTAIIFDCAGIDKCLINDVQLLVHLFNRGIGIANHLCKVAC